MYVSTSLKLEVSVLKSTQLALEYENPYNPLCKTFSKL